MWNQSVDLKESCLTVETQCKRVENTQFKYEVNCRFLRSSINVCINKKCKNNAFMCKEQSCKCRNEHVKCYKMETQNLIYNIENKIVTDQSMQGCLNKRIEQFIDYLTRLREETINQIKKKSQYLGLNNIQKQLLQGIKINNTYTTTGQKIWKILHLNEQNKVIQDSINFTLKSLNNRFNQAKKQLQNILGKIKMKIDGCFNKVKNHLQISRFVFGQNPKHRSLTKFVTESCGSKIITEVSQVEKLLSFFTPRKIKSFKVIYRASENQFSTDKFHQKCDNIPDTLVLLENQYGKKIGGYAPFKWVKQVQVGSTIYTQNSFLFSLTNGDKFQPKQKSYSRASLFFSQIKGPFFGNSGSDLNISNQSNTNRDSYSRINNTYFNQLYQNSEKESWSYFCGNQSSNNFKIKDWQVFSLQLQ